MAMLVSLLLDRRTKMCIYGHLSLRTQGSEPRLDERKKEDDNEVKYEK